MPIRSPRTRPTGRWRCSRGWVTETDARITALRELADPRLVPPEALDWLASYVALTFDQRIDEAVRRQLLSEIVALYQQRGTVPGLTRLLSILARRRSPWWRIFGCAGSPACSSTMPPRSSGRGCNSATRSRCRWRKTRPTCALEADYAALMLRRELVRAAGGTPCPPDDPPYPIETDPLARFVRRFAHRFTVVLPCRRTDTLEAVIQDAVEANKPAHTLHTLCWLDAGFQLGLQRWSGCRVSARRPASSRVSSAPRCSAATTRSAAMSRTRASGRAAAHTGGPARIGRRGERTPPPLAGGGWGEGLNVSFRGRIARALSPSPSRKGRGRSLPPGHDTQMQERTVRP